VLLSDGLRNLPLLRIEVLHHHACDAGAEQAAFSIERIRIDGSSGANHCGFAVLANKPGVIAIFIKGSKGPKGLTIQTKQIPRASPPGAEALAPGAEPSVRSAAENSVVRTSEKTPSAHAPLPREATPGDASQLEAAIAALPWFLATPSQGDASLSMAPSSEAAESKIAPRPVSHRVRKTLQCKALPARIPEVGARLDEHSSSPKTFPPPKPDSLAKQVPTDASKAKGSTNDSSPVPAKPSAANAPKPGS
jgi:hypothetical protein